jgi:hypothetical protein
MKSLAGFACGGFFIVQSEGKYVLQDLGASVTFQLDDQEKVKDFNGQNVMVTGMLDTKSNTVHVADIEVQRVTLISRCSTLNKG